MKFCKDCKYYSSLTYVCYHPKSPIEVDLVNGEKKYTYCSWARDGRVSSGFCGKEAKYFEQKENIIKRFFQKVINIRGK